MCNDCLSQSLKNKIKSSICCFCIPPDQLAALEYHQPRKPYRWLKSQSKEFQKPKDRRRRGLFGRICNAAKKSRKKHHNSTDFSYDPMSYALNFEDESSREDEPFVRFSSRLPISPEKIGKMPSEIIACVYIKG